MAAEETVFRVMCLPDGRDWMHFADLNMVGLSDRLDLDGRIAAVVELQKQWKREHLALIRSA